MQSKSPCLLQDRPKCSSQLACRPMIPLNELMISDDHPMVSPMVIPSGHTKATSIGSSESIVEGLMMSTSAMDDPVTPIYSNFHHTKMYSNFIKN